MKKIVKVGSRESALAVAQAKIVMDAIKLYSPEIEPVLVTMVTTGDKILDKSLDKVGGKGLFVKELELALLGGQIDLCVHSYKDMPIDEDPNLPIVALSEREDPRDILVLGDEKSDMPIGSSSARRRLQLQKIMPNIEIKPVRGNVLTRLRKLDEGEFSALALAGAGLNRLSLQHRISRVFSVDEMLPAASQGILAVQGRAGENYDYLQGFHSETSKIISLAERAFIKALGGGCFSPCAAYATLVGTDINLQGLYVPTDTEQMYTGSICGDAKDAESLGIRLAEELKGRQK